jgi:hypothetical protein
LRFDEAEQLRPDFVLRLVPHLIMPTRSGASRPQIWPPIPGCNKEPP